MMEKLEHTLGKLDQRQLVMSEEMRKFVHEIRSIVGQSQTESQEQLKSLLAPYPAKGLAIWPVDKRVGDVRNKDPSLIEPGIAG